MCQSGPFACLVDYLSLSLLMSLFLSLVSVPADVSIPVSVSASASVCVSIAASLSPSLSRLPCPFVSVSLSDGPGFFCVCGTLGVTRHHSSL